MELAEEGQEGSVQGERVLHGETQLELDAQLGSYPVMGWQRWSQHQQLHQLKVVLQMLTLELIINSSGSDKYLPALIVRQLGLVSTSQISELQ